MRHLTTEFTENELVNLHAHHLICAKQICSDKLTFHQNEINGGHCSRYHIDMMEIYFKEFKKWVGIVSAAKERDRKAELELFKEYEDH